MPTCVIHAARLARPYWIARCGHPAAAGCRQERHQHQRLQPATALGRRAPGGDREAACPERRDVAARRGLNPGYAANSCRSWRRGCARKSTISKSLKAWIADRFAVPTDVFKISGCAEPNAVDPNDRRGDRRPSLNGMYGETCRPWRSVWVLPLERVDTGHRVFRVGGPADRSRSDTEGPRQPLQLGAGVESWQACHDSPCPSTGTWRRPDLDDPQPPSWRIHVQGQPGVRIALDVEKRAGDTSPTSAEQIAVAGTVINAIPIVCAAPPGVMTRPLATPYRFGLAHPLSG